MRKMKKLVEKKNERGVEQTERFLKEGIRKKEKEKKDGLKEGKMDVKKLRMWLKNKEEEMK